MKDHSHVPGLIFVAVQGSENISFFWNRIAVIGTPHVLGDERSYGLAIEILERYPLITVHKVPCSKDRVDRFE